MKLLQILINRVVQKFQFLNNFRLKTAKCRAFCKTWETTHKVVEQVQCITVDSSDYSLYEQRGICYLKLKLYNDAIINLNRSININKNNASAFLNRGRAYYATNSMEKSITDFTQAILVNPDLVDAYYERGNAYKEIRNDNKAIDLFDNPVGYLTVLQFFRLKALQNCVF
jgi:tetratricopeptide (TPR) repeat protein